MNIDSKTTIIDLHRIGKLSTRAVNICLSKNIVTVDQLLLLSSSDIKKIKNCGAKTIEELNTIKNEISIICSENKNNISQQTALALYKALPLTTKEEFIEWINLKFDKLKSRTKNIFSNYNNINLLISIFYSSSLDFLSIKGCGKLSNLEITQYLSEVQIKFEELISNTEINSTNNNELENQILELRRDYNFLPIETCKSIINFKNKHNHYPYLYIIKQYILYCDNHKIQIHKDYYGINQSKIRYSIADIANYNKLTKERIRQIVNKRIPLPDIFQPYINELVRFIDDVIAFDSDILVKIQNENMLYEHIEETALLICALSENHTIVKIDNFCKQFIVHKSLIENVKMSILKEICREIDLRHSQMKEIDIHQFIKASTSLKDDDIIKICPIYSDYISNKYNIKINNNRFIIVPPNYFDISAAIESILAQNGAPMSFNELFTSFNNIYPSHAINSYSNFRSYILKNHNIVPKGKSGIYILANWDNHFTGTITDYVEYLLKYFNEPLYFDDIASLVIDEFPNTNNKSIYSLITGNKDKRFIIYNNDYIGLANKEYHSVKIIKKKSIKRFSFDHRFEAFKNFVLVHKRFPLNTGSDNEQTLARWLNNIHKSNITVSSQQLALLNNFLTENKELPQNGTEYRFQQKCDKIKIYIYNNFKLPTFSDSPREYMWLKDNLDKYTTYTDNRKLYFEQLLEYLKHFGFYIEEND